MRGRCVTFFIASAVFCGILLDISSGPAAERQKTVSDLKLIVVAAHRSQDTGFFNDILGPDDIVFTCGAKIKLLQRVTKPKTMIGAGAVSSLKKELAKLKGTRVDYIQYNPEQWKESHTPKEETANLVDAVKSIRLLAEQYKAKLSFTPDHILLDKYGERTAPLVDMFGIQMQRYQRDSLEEFRKEAERKAAIVRRGSKTVPVIIQLSLAPPKWKEKILPDGTKKRVILRDKKGGKVYEAFSIDMVLRQIEAVKDIADGIAFLYHEGTRDELRKLITRLRMSQN